MPVWPVASDDREGGAAKWRAAVIAASYAAICGERSIASCCARVSPSAVGAATAAPVSATTAQDARQAFSE